MCQTFNTCLDSQKKQEDESSKMGLIQVHKYGSRDINLHKVRKKLLHASWRQNMHEQTMRNKLS
jgi:hypothetical protein